MDINQVITLGIGTPSDLLHFFTFGLGSGPPLELGEPEIVLFEVNIARTMDFSVER